MSRESDIQQLYKNVLGRDADIGGLKHYVNSNLSLFDIQLQLSSSEEFKDKFKVTEFPTEEFDNPLPIFIISLERRTDRKYKLSNALNNLKINNYHFINAVDGSTLQNDISSEYYDKEKAELTKRGLVPNEIACSLSQLKILQKMVDENIEYAIIMEDDCIPNINLYKFLKSFKLDQTHFELLLLGYWSSNEWYNTKPKLKTDVPVISREMRSITYLDNTIDFIGEIGIHKPFYPSFSLDYVSGAHCGLYTLEIAKKILNANYPVYVEADNVWNIIPNIDVKFAYPLCAYTEYIDSDLSVTRPLANGDNMHLFCQAFKDRINHPDFGT